MNIKDLQPGSYTEVKPLNINNLAAGSYSPVGQPNVAPTENLSSSIWSKIAGVGKAVGNALTSSEQAFGSDIAAASSQILPKSVTGVGNIDKTNQTHQATIDSAIKGLHQAQQTGGDTKKWLTIIGQVTGQPVNTIEDLYPALKKSNLQVVGDAAGVLLDILSAGSYGNAAKGAKTGQFLSSAANKAALAPGEAITKNIVESSIKPGLSNTLKSIGINTAERAAVGAGTGYAYDVAGNLTEGKTGAEALKPGFGALAGGALPVVIGGVRAGVAITKDTAPRFINSLIKPKTADFSYGKDPGRTVSELGITGNSLPDFEKNIHTAKQDIGEQIGSIYSSSQNANIKIDAADQLTKIDDAIKTAAKGGKGNQGVVTTLQNIKDALLYEHQVNPDGVIEKIGTQPRDLSALNPQEAFDLKKVVAEQTKFTGNPSDDKTVNSILKSIYGGIKEKLNDSVGVNNPEIIDLNQKFADLTSAELATRNRDLIVKRSDIISMPIKVGIVSSLLATAFTTGGVSIPVLLAGAGAASLDKALQSTAVKTRLAAWLGKQSPSTIAKILEKNPEIRTTLYRLVPKLFAQLGQKPADDNLSQ